MSDIQGLQKLMNCISLKEENSLNIILSLQNSQDYFYDITKSQQEA